MPVDEPSGQLVRTEERTLRRLGRFGCGPQESRLLLAHLDQEPSLDGGPGAGLQRIAEFAVAIGAPAARDYFRAIRETKAVARLTDPAVLEFARALDRHTAEWYFWAIWGTKAVEELTSAPVLDALGFFRAIDSPATVEYFLAIRETRAATALTDRRVLEFAKRLGSDAAVEYFGAFWETKAVARLTDPAVLEFAGGLGADAAREYFRAMRESRAVRELTDPGVLATLTTLGTATAQEFFRAVRETKAAGRLTDENVLLFAESIGRGPSREYFRAIGSTRAVEALTNPRLLKASGVIRSIGRDAALDYFLAAAASGGAPDGDGRSPVPVLTLLDLPAYDRYRPVGLLGASASFWLGVWVFSRGSLADPVAAWGLGVALAAWAAVLVGAYVLFGSVASRAAEQFLEGRRRLLNEHGIRWHDCLTGDRTCELCWGPARIHEDRRFDYGAFCRCPAC